MNESTLMATSVVSAMIRGGVADVVVAPGSRSAPLALAVYDADARGALRLHVRIDERTAGFLALGLAKGSHRPTAVLTTSGTAVANLHPAVLEASHAGVPLVVLSADRPAAMRGTGANQTTEQSSMFGLAAPSSDIGPGDRTHALTAVMAALRRHGPSQLNLQFAEPLVPIPGDSPADADPVSDHDHDPDSRADHATAGEPEQLPAGPRTVVVAGDDAGPPARRLAEAADWPLLAEPTSGARTGTQAVRSYRLLLQGELGQRVERVVVAGHPTISRPVTALLSRSDVEVVSVRGRSGVSTDPGRRARHLDLVPTTLGADDPAWMESWRAADRTIADALDRLVESHDAALPLRVAAEVAAAVLPGALLVVGSSQPIRDLDLMAPTYPVGGRRRILGNRGLSGIDGLVSTAVGAALGRHSTRSLAYLGDVTFLHDAGGLILGPEEPRPDLTLVVANDNGGAIFSLLEQGKPDHAEPFERVFGTPHGVDLRALCAATSTTYERATDASTLRDLLATQPSGIRIIEVPLTRNGRRGLEADLQGLLAAVT